MGLIIIGFIILIASLAMARGDFNIKRYAGIARVVGLLVILLGFLIASIIQIDAGQIGVQKLFGKVQNDILPSGLHLINPLVDVERMDIKTQNYTMSGVHDEGAKQGDDAI